MPLMVGHRCGSLLLGAATMGLAVSPNRERSWCEAEGGCPLLPKVVLGR